MDNHERAVKAITERWHPTIPKATHSGILNIAGQEIACDVLKDGRRILRHRNFAKFMGKSKANSEDMERARTLNLPVFIIANNLTPYLTPVLAERGKEIFYKGLDGRKLIGYDATLLPEVCKIYVQGESDGILQKQQLVLCHLLKDALQQ